MNLHCVLTRSLSLIGACLCMTCCSSVPEAFIDAEALVSADKFISEGGAGGWVVDQQAMDVLGSPYLLAHGAGVPVQDVCGAVQLPSSGRWHVWVRTYNWTSPWSEKEGPGAFNVTIDGNALEKVCGNTGDKWEWQYAGSFRASDACVTVGLHDLTGFDGRCDALAFSRSRHAVLPDTVEGMHGLRLAFNPSYDTPCDTVRYDFVVVGGGISGICAAVAAARLGLRTAIVNDRPVLGGNNSAEIRVHLGGMIELEPYPNLGNLIKEFGHKKCANAASAESYDDPAKERILREAGVDIYAPFHAVSVRKDSSVIASVDVRNILSGGLLRLEAPLFADCTGDGNLGYMAGADWTDGREAQSEFDEPMAPQVADKEHLGASLLWNSRQTDSVSVFPEFEYGLHFSDSTVQAVKKSEWYWETGLGDDMIKDVERIRDFGLLAVYSNWSYLKNHSCEAEKFSHRELDWVAYITGKRESRRLLGDHILTENDIVDAVPYPDATCSTSWSIDLHYRKPENSRDFPGMEFMTYAEHKYFPPYPIPYRCLYSRNVDNLFLAGRDISATHVALGSTRVIRTCGMMGEVVGMAASVCKEHGSLPRSVYSDYLPQLQALMKEGVGKKGLPNDQTFCIHGCFPPK